MESDMEKENTKRTEWLHFLQQARDFRKKCLDEIEKGGVWKGRSPGPYCILHCIPMPTAEQQHLNIESVSKDMQSNFIVFGKENVKCQLNSKGLLIETNYEDRIDKPERIDEWYFYRRGFQRTQMFHTGILEAVYAPTLEKRERNEALYLSLYAFEFFCRQIRNYIEKAPVLGFLGAGVIGVSILGVKDYSIHTPIISARYLDKFAQQPADTDEVLNSAKDDIKLEMKILNILDIKNADKQVLQPIFDYVWRCFGFPGCDRDFQDEEWRLQE